MSTENSDTTVLTGDTQQEAGGTDGAQKDTTAEGTDAGVEKDTTKEGNTEGETKPGEPAKATKAVEEELTFKLPDGAVVDEVMLTDFRKLATDWKLKPEQAQSLVDLHMKSQTAFNQKSMELFQAQQQELLKQAKADKEVGGASFDSNVATAKKALSQFGTPELMKVLNESGLGNHPEVIRAFYRAGKALAEDSVAGTVAAPVARVPTEEALHRMLYPTMFQDKKE